MAGRSGLAAIVGDTHMPRGARTLPARCVELLRSADVIVHTGDFTAVSVLDDLSCLAPLVAVHGNMDDADVRRRLGARAVFEHGGLRIGVVHDGGSRSGRHERLLSSFPDCDVVVYGHTHVPEVAEVDGRFVVNPGSPTERRRTSAHTMAVLENGVPRLVEL
jgi:putative phosphoesterase